jgi:hypothetical protein
MMPTARTAYLRGIGVSESASEDITELSDDSELSQAGALDVTEDGDDEPARAAREGLPRSFRMRHDAHYVDELMSRTEASPLESDARAKRAPEPRPRPVGDAPATPAVQTASHPGRSIALLAARLESAVAHADVLGSPASSPLVAASVRVELARVARLARAAAVLDDREPPLRRMLSAREVADAAGTASVPVVRQAGLDCEIAVDDPSFTILGDPDLVQLTIAGTVDAIVDVLTADRRRARVLDGREGVPRVTIALQSVKVRPALIIDVICPALALTEAQADRLFDDQANDPHGASSVAILLPAAARIVKAHGGRADVKRHNGVGTTLTYVFPQSAAEASY